MSRDAGYTWRPVTGFSRGLAVSAVSYHATDAASVYAYVNGPGHGLMRNRDAGATWEAVGLVTGDEPVIALAVGPGEGVAVATKAADILSSTDGGRNWQRRLGRGRIPAASR